MLGNILSRLAIIALCAAGVFAGTYSADAQNISVTIDNQQPVNPAPASCNTPASCVNIGGSYGVLQIDPYFAGSGSGAYARVDVPIAETSQDTLEIINARITNNDSVNKTFTIIFERKDVKLPNTMKWYNTYLIGNFGPANGNTISVVSSYKLDGGLYQSAGSTLTYTLNDCPIPCSTTIPSNRKTGKQFNPGATARWLKVEITITLMPLSYVDLNSGVKMVTSSNPPDIETATSTSNPFCLTAQSTAATFNCPGCLTQDGQVAEDAKVRLFASTNRENIAHDMARGGGEYLASLAMLFHIPAHEQPAFFVSAQGEYQTLSGQEVQAVEQVVTTLHERARTYQASAANY